MTKDEQPDETGPEDIHQELGFTDRDIVIAIRDDNRRLSEQVREYHEKAMSDLLFIATAVTERDHLALDDAEGVLMRLLVKANELGEVARALESLSKGFPQVSSLVLARDTAE